MEIKLHGFNDATHQWCHIWYGVGEQTTSLTESVLITQFIVAIDKPLLELISHWHEFWLNASWGKYLRTHYCQLKWGENHCSRAPLQSTHGLVGAHHIWNVFVLSGIMTCQLITAVVVVIEMISLEKYTHWILIRFSDWNLGKSRESLADGGFTTENRFFTLFSPFSILMNRFGRTDEHHRKFNSPDPSQIASEGVRTVSMVSVHPAELMDLVGKSVRLPSLFSCTEKSSFRRFQ